jgi:gliding motility-associated-like protein
MLFMVSQLDVLKAQTEDTSGLFVAPDTVCAKQIINLRSKVLTASSHYWGFCSGYLQNYPHGYHYDSSLTFEMNVPSDIDIAKDGDNYYGFVLNNASNEFLRFNFGNSLYNVPSVTNFGDMTGVLPTGPNSLYIVKDTMNNNWHIFVAGGNDATNSSLARIDFRNSLANTPNIANFGNFNSVLNAPRGLFIAQDADSNWYGYAVNSNQLSNSLVFFNFRGKNISITPSMTDLGTLGNSMAQPSDLAAVKDNGEWYFFVTNFFNNTVTRIDLGTGLVNPTPVATNLGTMNNTLFSPSSISVIKECGGIFAFITDLATSELVRVQMPAALGPYTSFNMGNIPVVDSANLNNPSALSHILRYHDNLFAFATNLDTPFLSRFAFEQCTDASVQSSTFHTPPPFSYDSAGLYNVYYIVDEGLPTMQIDCKQIRVLPIPAMTITPDTLICQRDTITLVDVSVAADTIKWSPKYNIDDSTQQIVRVWPEHTVKYHIELDYPSGCIVDTNITVNVSKVTADAGPDRYLADGATTLLGGPNTSMGPNYVYSWSPISYLNSTDIMFPQANPPTDFTYYLHVTELNDTLKCTDIDTVVIRNRCLDINLPNAFIPTSGNPSNNRFGLLNKQVIKLNYFRIFDRWGKLVFETTDPTKEWDGTINGKAADQGVYVWEADGFCESGKRVIGSGNVTLLK